MTIKLLDKWQCLAAAMDDTRLQAVSKLVYTRLLLHHNGETGRCDPSKNTLGRELNRTARTIATAITLLHKLGYIQQIQDRGLNRSNQYELWLEPGKPPRIDVESERRQVRKPISVKEEKKKMNEYSAEIRHARGFDSIPNQNPAEKIRKAQEALEKAFVKQFANAETAHLKLMRIDSGTYETISQSFVAEQVSLQEAVEMLNAKAG